MGRSQDASTLRAPTHPCEQGPGSRAEQGGGGQDVPLGSPPSEPPSCCFPGLPRTSRNHPHPATTPPVEPPAWPTLHPQPLPPTPLGWVPSKKFRVVPTPTNWAGVSASDHETLSLHVTPDAASVWPSDRAGSARSRTLVPLRFRLLPQASVPGSPPLSPPGYTHPSSRLSGTHPPRSGPWLGVQGGPQSVSDGPASAPLGTVGSGRAGST